ncbi:MAG TPA: YihY/virulence factor BrkB family protein, partial [Methylomirabilota bacterium]
MAASGGPGAPVVADPARAPATDPPGPAAPPPRPVGAPVRSAFRYFFEHDGFFLAAGLSFYIVICIVPFLLLVIAGSAFWISDDMVLREVVDRLGSLLPVYQAEMEAALRGVIAARGVTSLVGTLILLFFASQLFAATRLVLNRVFQHKGRGLIHGMLFDLGMILSLTVGFLVSIGVTAAFAWVRGLALLVGRGPMVPIALHWIGLGLTVLLDTILFVMIFRFVPNRRIRWGSVVIGGLATAVLWELAKQAFRWYIERAGVYSAVYGSLGVTIALMMWVYYSA